MIGLSQNTALAIVLLVTFLWGSWFQVVKHTGDYPIYAFLSWLYVFSIFIVWGSIGAMHTVMIPKGIWNEIRADIPRTVIVLLCGGLYAVGMQLQLSVVSRVGLILSSSVTSTCSILSGILLTAVLGGIAEGSSVYLIILAAVLLICGTIVCQIAGVMRDRQSEGGRRENSRPQAVSPQMADSQQPQEKPRSHSRDLVILVVSSAILIPFYSVASSIGLSTDLRPEGFSSFTCMGILSVGALLGTSVYTALRLTQERKWKLFLHPGKGLPMILAMALIGAFCHFGGNILHSVAAPVVSIVIATGIGYSYGMWSYLWGLVYGEFKGAGGRTFGVLGGGILLFAAGVLILTLNIA